MPPNDWETRTIGEIARVTSGGTPSRKRPDYWCSGEVPWIRTTEVQNCVLNKSSVKEHISLSGLQNSSAKLLPVGTILLAMIGQGKTRGQVALLNLEAATNQNCAAIVLKQPHSSLFFFYQLISQYQKIRGSSNSAGQSNLSGTIVKSLSVNVPPPKEQKKIAQILSTWDKAITITEQLLANSQQQKKALMQQLLTDCGNREKINTIADRVQRKSDGVDHPILTISSITGFVRQEDRYSRYMAGESVKNYTLLQEGEFAYNKGNSKSFEFGCIFDLKGFDTGLVPHVYVCFRLKPDYDHSYFKHLFAADFLKPQLGRLVNTGVRNNGLLNIKPAEFMSTTVPVPPLGEQKRIAHTLDVASQQVDRLEAQLHSLHHEKKALMQQLLTGKRRVDVQGEE